MKILHVTDGSIYNYDGVSTYINELLECAYAGGEKLLVFTTVPLNPAKLRGVRHKAEVREFRNTKIFSSDKFNFSWPRGMKKAMNEFEPDLVWIHTIGPLGISAARLSKNKYSVIYTKHCFDGDLWCLHLRVPTGFQWFYKIVAIIVERMVLKYCDTVLYHFESTEKVINNKYFGKFKYMPPPLEGKFLDVKPVREKNQDDGTKTIGFCGRLDPEKSIDLIFAAADIYQKKYKNKQIRLLLIGEGHAAEAMVSKYPHINIKITGFVDDVIPYLDQLDAYVLASKTETTSLSSMEAYSRGLPVLSTPVGFLGQNVDKYQHVYNFNTAEELAMLINEVLNVKQISAAPPSIEPGSPIITFSKLHEMVLSEYQ